MERKEFLIKAISDDKNKLKKEDAAGLCDWSLTCHYLAKLVGEMGEELCNEFKIEGYKVEPYQSETQNFDHLIGRGVDVSMCGDSESKMLENCKSFVKKASSFFNVSVHFKGWIGIRRKYIFHLQLK